MTDTLPDRLSCDPRSPFHDEALLSRGIGIMFNGVEIRVAVGKTLDRRGNPLTVTLKGKVEPFFEDARKA